MRIKKLTLRKMSAKNFEKLLKELRACLPARRWAKGKTLQKVWATCDKGHWMHWLLVMNYGKDWPSRTESEVIRTKAWETYRRTTAIGEADQKAMADYLRKYIVIK